MKKPPRVGDRIRCADTRVVGVVIAIKNGLPIVKFEDGSEGLCSAAHSTSFN